MTLDAKRGSADAGGMEARLDILEREVQTIRSELVLIKTTYWMREDGRILDARLTRLESDVAQLKNSCGNMAESIAKLQSDIQQLKADLSEIKSRLGTIDGRMDKMDGRMDKMDGRMDTMDGRMDKMDGRMDRMEACLHRLETDVSIMKVQLSNCVTKEEFHREFSNIKKWIIGVAIAFMAAQSAMLKLIM